MKRFATILFLSIMGVVLLYTSYTLYIYNPMSEAMGHIGENVIDSTNLLSMFFSKSKIGYTIILIIVLCISFIGAFYILNPNKNRGEGLK